LAVHKPPIFAKKQRKIINDASSTTRGWLLNALPSTASQRRNIGIAVACFWLALSAVYDTPKFAFGYDDL
jgi:hypothetical protein